VRLTPRQEHVLYIFRGWLCYGAAMDRALVISSLQAAEEHLANDVQDIADQRDLISTLERTGHNATSAIARLREMEKTQTRHIADRERFRAQLASVGRPQMNRLS
jgi:biopolymer transport protein ExbB/TolQ